MGTSGRIATTLDFLFFDRRRVRIGRYLTTATRPAPRSGVNIARQLGGRLLARYITEAEAMSMTGPTGRTTESYATPTAYSPEEAPIWLITPASRSVRPFVILLDPNEIDWIIGPLQVGPAAGIQYILPNGYPPSAIVVPGAPTGSWYLSVT